MNILKKTISREDLVKEFLFALGGLLRITRRELEVLIELVKFEMNYVEVRNRVHNVINTENRKILTQRLHINNELISRYIKKFVDRGILIKNPNDKREIRVWHPLIPNISKHAIQITLLLKIKDD